MNTPIELLITLILYLGFFAWIGLRRGTLRELITFGTITLSWLALDQFGVIPVRLVNLGGKFIAFIGAGGLGANPDDAFAVLGTTPPTIGAEAQAGFLFILWLLIILAVYVVTQTFVPQISQIGSVGLAAILGVANGLALAVLLLPRLMGMVMPEATILPLAGGDTNFLDLFFNIIGLFGDGFVTIGSLIEPYSSIALLIGLTLILLVAASSLGKGKKRKKDQAEAES